MKEKLEQVRVLNAISPFNQLWTTRWITLYGNGHNVKYFDSFEDKDISKEMKRFIGNTNIARNIYRIQANEWIMYGYFCIVFIYFMIKGKISLDYTNLFSPNECEK